MGPPGVAPGERFAYSDTGYVILGEVIEVAMGQALGPAVRQLLGFDALGLQRTHWEQQEPDPLAGLRARQCLREHDTAGLDASFDLHGGGGLVSTVDELCHFTSALCQGRIFRHPERTRLRPAVRSAVEWGRRTRRHRRAGPAGRPASAREGAGRARRAGPLIGSRRDAVVN
jgi:CubicO group peptidase (beta-lactamase class C family)